MSQLNALLADGGVLLAVGMVSVFAILTLLVFAIGGLAKVAALFDSGHAEVATSRPTSPTATPPNQNQLLAVISSAVHKYRSRS